MLCFQCCRVAASALRRGSTVARSGLAYRPSLRAPTTSVLSSSITRGSIASNTLRYSTDAAAKSAATENPLPEKPSYLNTAESAIWDKLEAEFSPTELTVQDISGGCGSMYGIEITSEKFRGANMLKQQRMVNAVLGEEMKGWHGLQLRTRIPKSESV
ncbi:bola-like protein [Poronia punctata]|nr:bola-like protein [Poronia punctata]